MALAAASAIVSACVCAHRRVFEPAHTSVRPYHTTLAVIQTISRERGVLRSEQVCVNLSVLLCEARKKRKRTKMSLFLLTCTCLRCLPIGIITTISDSTRRSCWGGALDSSPSHISCSKFMVPPPSPKTLNQLKQSRSLLQTQGAAESSHRTPPAPHALQWRSNLKPTRVALKCARLLRSTLSTMMCNSLYLFGALR